MKMRIFFFVATVLLPVGICVSQSIDPSYLKEMPSVARVMREVKGSDPIDTAAKQSGAFNQFTVVIRDIALAAGRNSSTVPLTPDENRLMMMYASASIETMKPVRAQMTQFPPEKRMQLTGYATNPGFRAELLNQFCSKDVRDQYARALEKFAARHQEFLAMQKAYDEQTKAATSGGGPNSDPGTLAARRCYASGRGLKECFAEVMAEQLPGFIPIAKQKKPTPGLRLTGKFEGSGISFVFPNSSKDISMSRSVMLPESCGNPVHRETPYTISNTGTSIILTVATNPPVVFTLQPNLEWTGPGRVIIAGEKIVGYGPPHEVQVSSQVATGEKWMYNGVEVPSQFYPGAVFGGYNYKTVNSTQTVRDPITEPIKAPCTFGTITLMGPATDVASVLQSFGLQEIPPGLHMVGDYVGTNGLTIKFHSEKLATTICGDAEWADKYAVMPTGKDIHIRFQNGKSPYEMILRPDGTLAPASSGSVTVNAREMIGMKDGEGVFKPLPPKTCALSALSPQN